MTLLEEALLQYDMPRAKCELIRHNENLTYCLDEKYLLRIHKPKVGFNKTSIFGNIDMMGIYRNEIKFLEHLARCKLNVQTPIYNKNDEPVTVLSDGTMATMLSWLPGRILNKNDLTYSTGMEMGLLLARLHFAALDFRSDAFISYDRDLCRRLSELLMKYYMTNHLDRDMYHNMADALTVIGNGLWQAEDAFIIVHSDLSLSNILVTDQGLAPIDFSLMGYSIPMLDFGSVFSLTNDMDFRNSVIASYESVTGHAVNRKQIEICFSLQILLGIILHYELWMNEPWFKERLLQWCNDVFLPLVERVTSTN